MKRIFLVGAPKAGTTSVADFLARHPDVCPGRDKEPNYFSDVSGRAGSGTRVAPTWRDYESNYTDCLHTQSRLDASTTYLYCDTALDRIAGRWPDARILVVLREPVSRAYSHYLMDRDVLGQEGRDFLRAMDRSYHSRHGFHGSPVNPYIFASTYAPHVEQVLRTFGRDTVRIMLFEDLIADPARGLLELCRFLDLDSSRTTLELPESNTFRSLRFRRLGRLARGCLGPVRNTMPPWLQRMARAVLVRHQGAKPALDAELRAELYHRYFEADVDALGELLDLDLSRWRTLYR